jgi:hypothetical protein
LATLVLDQSLLGAIAKNLSADLTLSVYVDDISLSSNNIDTLLDGYAEICAAVDASGFTISPEKSVPPCESLTVFNCHLQTGTTFVTLARKEIFLSKQPNPAQLEGFDRYVRSVERGNN